MKISAWVNEKDISIIKNKALQYNVELYDFREKINNKWWITFFGENNNIQKFHDEVLFNYLINNKLFSVN